MRVGLPLGILCMLVDTIFPMAIIRVPIGLERVGSPDRSLRCFEQGCMLWDTSRQGVKSDNSGPCTMMDS